jgi:hypothetical protein
MDVTTQFDYWAQPPPDKGSLYKQEVWTISKIQAKQEAFMLCGLISAVNETARYFKLQHCRDCDNLNKTYNFHDDPYS